MNLIIADKRMPDEAKKTLSTYGKTLWFETKGITYESISGHPDIFIFQNNEMLIVAPNLPKALTDVLTNEHIEWIYGQSNVGQKYPSTAKYNALTDYQIFMHNLKLTDPKILELTTQKKILHVEQGYCRCNCLSLGHNRYICSDKGIAKVLTANNCQVLYVIPNEIILPGVSHGFIGGTAGINKNNVFLCGSLLFHPQGEQIREFIFETGKEIIELYQGPLFDVGSILFLEKNNKKSQT